MGYQPLSTPQPETPVVVSLRHVSRVFDGRRVLNDISLDIVAGEFVVLVGKSGCGKSTLLKIVAGLDHGAEGELSIPGRRSIVFQDARLLPWKRVWENVAFGLDGPKKHLYARAQKALEEVRLPGFADYWPLRLSGGEAQRVALARALVREPELLLLDEPFAALDALTRLKMQDQVLQLWRQHAVATLFVTHDVDEALALADRIVLIEDGRIAQIFPVPLARPRQREEAGFAALRKELLTALGVGGPIAANIASPRPAAQDAPPPSQRSSIHTRAAY
ncbi:MULTISPECIES: ABC transporter ATP-binding protein [unclassified Chelatococcus]|uniref:ABC transporter ATP-binding protein n=1 Tax=unclassified Chelatococcus TaxID=2638111 RepID=UPI001BCDAFF3|nr:MULTISPECIES: ABC transporter ATP-binding protein [unclassified Chelatococcus]CAH1656045.1 aliphatic sulfonate ABC transporter ATP binding subunit [Hyphomicrobiales bacterium]MBS7742515.1 ABC transporter ATP-binding protein [Chelatococcus sp. HY11]MBX3542367.1 ABC transporter ATP-binding protein [Chelatococcus sp.]MCO5075415.1 ABC transporter ATP-binding protein [Chelatococcus sp.]CAH1695721.1 aliphatic sulfonate ABC transporter ATP binding subunit [Hyphomicrobiales bacterium]